MSSSPLPRPVEILPSVLTADYARLGEACIGLEAGGVDRIHWDVMDGNFVPNLSFGADIIRSLRPVVGLPFEAHLMVVEPTWILESMVAAGCERITVHAEACTHLHRTLGRIAELGVAAGVALNPGTPAEAVADVLDLVDLVLVMTVNPGFGGQSYLASMEPKIARVRSMIDASGRDIDLEVDGGIAPATIAAAATAGANAFVVGSAMFRDPEGFTHATADLRSRAEAAGAR
ncbi:MAG: ribulose-phosphate 3-epimerase [Acidobacteria bacterium]|nr:ribulose-phosphate 3-epimerase [Acidobacteriota bacterium]